MKIMILGFGLTGKSLFEYLKRNNEVYIYDIKEIESEYYFSYKRLKKELPFFDYIIRSPGISSKSKVYKLCQMLTFNMVSEVEFFKDKLKDNIVIGVTGSNGKTTLVTMLYYLLSEHKKVQLLGNIGTPISSKINEINKGDIVILELSSFMLEDTYSLRIDYGVITNLTSNHLDNVINKYYYFGSKLRLIHLTNNLYIDKKIKKYCKEKNVNLISKLKSAKIDSLNEINQNHFNVCFDILKKLGIKENKIIESIKTYKLPKYRNELIKSTKYLTFINDSKSTSVDALKASLSLFKDKKRIIIIGGINKSGSFKRIHFEKDDIILIFGRDKYKIWKSIGGIYFASLKDIFHYLRNVNEERYVIFSPACSSFDEYKSYENRGEEFNNLINIFEKLA